MTMKIDRWLADGANSPPTIITASDILTSGLTKGGRGQLPTSAAGEGCAKQPGQKYFVTNKHKSGFD